MRNITHRLISLLAALVFASAAAAQSVKYEKYTLPNGLKVILHEDHSVPLVAVNLWYHVGSKDEAPARTGFAHLFEHLMFMGTDRVPTGQFDGKMEESGGSNNASTSNDRTNYYSVGPAHTLPLLLWLEADRLEDLGRTMDKRKLDVQREVVRNERRETENSPYGKADLKLTELLFPKGHPYHHSVIGSHADLEAASVSDVQSFFATYYVPNNASLVVAGDFSSAEVKPLIDRLFSSIKQGPKPPHREASQPKLNQVVTHDMTDQVQAPRITIAWHSPAAYKPGDTEMNLAAAVLSRGISSRLYQRLVYADEPLATDVAAYQESLMLGSIFLIEATGRPGTSLDKLQAEIDSVVNEFVKAGPTKKELERNVAGLEYSIMSGLQSVQGKADTLNAFEFHFGEPNSFKRVLDAYLKATPESVRKAASEVLKPNARVILRVTPQPDGQEEAAEDERRGPSAEPPSAQEPPKPVQGQRPQTARDAEPKLGPAKDWKIDPPTEIVLANGVKLNYWHRPELPLMSITTVLSAGADDDAAGSAGLSNLTIDMIDEGAGTRGAAELEEAFDLLGASYGASAGRDSSVVGLASTTSKFADAVALYADTILRPRFEEREWQRVKRLQIEGLEQALDDPGTVGRRVLLREFFGAAHPYGRPVSGTVASVTALSLDAVRARYKSMFAPSRATMFAAGSMPPNELKSLLDRHFSTWTGESGGARPTYPPPANSKLRVVLVEKPGAPQTVVSFAMPAPDALDPRRVPYQALGTVLGGTFTSRLNSNLREEKGYTYGAGARFAMEARAGYVLAVASVRTDVTGASIKEFLAEFAKLRGGDVTDAEMTKARNTLRTEVVEAGSSLRGLVALAIEQHRMGRPFSALAADLSRLEKLTAGDLNGLAKDALPTEQALLVLVGDRAQITEQLKGLGLPEPEIVKAE